MVADAGLEAIRGRACIHSLARAGRWEEVDSATGGRNRSRFSAIPGAAVTQTPRGLFFCVEQQTAGVMSVVRGAAENPSRARRGHGCFSGRRWMGASAVGEIDADCSTALQSTRTGWRGQCKCPADAAVDCKGRRAHVRRGPACVMHGAQHRHECPRKVAAMGAAPLVGRSDIVFQVLGRLRDSRGCARRFPARGPGRWGLCRRRRRRRSWNAAHGAH